MSPPVALNSESHRPTMKSLPLIAALCCAAAIPAHADGKIAFSSNRTGNYDIFVMNPDGSAQTNLTQTPNVVEEWPAWNPDGTRLVYTRTGDLWLVDADGFAPTRIPVPGGPNMAAFRPKTNLISYTRFGDSDTDIFTIRQDGQNETRILNNPYGDYCGRWNADGSKIVFSTYDDANNTPNIFVANPDGSGQHKITFSKTDRSPCWSPDGQQVVFESHRTGKEQIYIVDADGTGEKRLTYSAADDRYPVFSPDGKKIAFASNRDGDFEIFVMNVDGTGQTQLTFNTVDDNNPSWQPGLPEGTPSVSISDASAKEGDSGNTNMGFTVSLSAAATEPVTVNYRTYTASAQGGIDYVPVPSTPLVFSPGETSKTVNIQIIGDVLDEANETFNVRIAATGVGVLDPQGVGTIQDDDAVPVLNVQPVTMPEGNSGTSPATFIFSLSKASGRDVSVAYSCLDETAKTGNDYQPKNGTLVIPAGQTSAVLEVPVVGDTILEDNESFVVRLGSPVNCTLAKNQVRCTITNDDTTPYISIGNASGSEGSVLTFWVSLSHIAGTDISVKFATTDVTAVAGADYAAKQGTVIIPAGATSRKVGIQTLDDDTPESDETFRIRLSDATGGVLTGVQAVGTITSDDFPDIDISSVSMKEGKAGQRDMVFTITLSEPVPFVVSVLCQTSDGSALAGEDYVAANGLVSFAPNQLSRTFSVPVRGDTAFEATEEFYVNLSDASGGTIATPLGVGTIINDDVKAAVSGAGS